MFKVSKYIKCTSNYMNLCHSSSKRPLKLLATFKRHLVAYIYQLTMESSGVTDFKGVCSCSNLEKDCPEIVFVKSGI